MRNLSVISVVRGCLDMNAKFAKLGVFSETPWITFILLSRAMLQSQIGKPLTPAKLVQDVAPHYVSARTGLRMIDRMIDLGLLERVPGTKRIRVTEQGQEIPFLVANTFGEIFLSGQLRVTNEL